jgi:hypothetical protein
MATRVGEYFAAKYIKHPAPSNWLANGEGLDAGSVQIIDSNVSWLCRESVRHLFWVPGPGSVTTYQNASDVYASIEGFGTPPSGLTLIDAQQIPWNRATAIRFGPFPMICDASNSDGEALPRPIRICTKMTYASTTPTLYLALSTKSDPASIYAGDYLALSLPTIAASGSVTEKTVSIDNPVPRTIVEPWDSRRVTSAPSAFANMTLVLPLYVWVGWRALGAGATLSIDSVSAYEVRT